MTKQAIHLKDLGESPYIASDDYPVGKTFPLLEVRAVTIEKVPVPNSKKTNQKAVVWFKGADKGWCMNKTEGRKIGAMVGATENLQDTWIGIKIQLHVVGDVRRPDGSRGNAFRVLHAEGRAKTAQTVHVEHAEDDLPADLSDDPGPDETPDPEADAAADAAFG